MNSRLVIWGAGGHGKVVLDVARSMSPFQQVIFVDRDHSRIGIEFCECPVVGESQLDALAGSSFHIAVGDNRIRSKCFDRAVASGLVPATLIHTSAVISPSATIGNGTLAMPGVIVNADAVIGEDCILNSGAIVEHDCTLGDHVHISPRAALGGAVRIGRWAFVGIGAVVLPGVTVGEETTVGAGSVVIRETPSHCTVVGVPAKVLIRSS